MIYDIFTISFSETLQVHKSFTVHTEACEAGKTDYENCPSPKCKSQDIKDYALQFKSKSVTEQQKSCRRKSCPGIMNDSYEPDFPNFRPPGFDELKNPNIANESPQSSSGRSSDAYVEVCSEVGGDNSPKSALRNFLTIVALSLHCVFEGIGIGLQDTLDGLWIMFAGKTRIWDMTWHH